MLGAVNTCNCPGLPKAFRYQAFRVTGTFGLFSSLRSAHPAQLSNSSSPVSGKSAAEMQYSGNDLLSLPPMRIAANP